MRLMEILKRLKALFDNRVRVILTSAPSPSAGASADHSCGVQSCCAGHQDRPDGRLQHRAAWPADKDAEADAFTAASVPAVRQLGDSSAKFKAI